MWGGRARGSAATCGRREKDPRDDVDAREAEQEGCSSVAMSPRPPKGGRGVRGGEITSSAKGAKLLSENSGKLDLRLRSVPALKVASGDTIDAH